MGKRRPSGDGMVRKREDGRWEGRIVVGHKGNGDSIFRYVSAGSQKELTAKLRQNIDAYQGVNLTEESSMTLSEWLDKWLELNMAQRDHSGEYAGGIPPDIMNHQAPAGQQAHQQDHPGRCPEAVPGCPEAWPYSGGGPGVWTPCPAGVCPPSPRGAAPGHGRGGAVENGLIPCEIPEGLRCPKDCYSPKKDSQRRAAGHLQWRRSGRIPSGTTSSTRSSPQACGKARSAASCGPTLTASREPSPLDAPSTAGGVEGSPGATKTGAWKAGSSPCRPARRSCCKSEKALLLPSGSSPTRFCRSSPCRRTWPTTG